MAMAQSFTQVSSLKYPGTLLYFFVGGGEVIREGGIIIRLAHTIFKISFFSPGYIIKGGVPISRLCSVVWWVDRNMDFLSIRRFG